MDKCWVHKDKLWFSMEKNVVRLITFILISTILEKMDMKQDGLINVESVPNPGIITLV